MIGQHLREGDLLARRYVLRERIGAGGMSVIWRAWDDALQRTVAVKVLDGPLGTERGDRELIRREARAAARIEHPHAIQVYDYGETVTPRGRVAAYVVMQLLDGVSLSSRLARGALPWPEAVATAGTVAEVLAAAHGRGVVHRDVTPENVMLTTDGVKLLDFGIATDVGRPEDTLTFGTPPYVAPERLAGGEASGATDVYALGVMLFEMLTGVTPFQATTWEEVDRLRGAGPPPLEVPGLPAHVAQLCRRCMAADPADRPTARDVGAALAAVRREPRRTWWAAVVAAAVAAALVMTVFLLVRGQSDASDPRRDRAAPATSGALDPPLSAGGAAVGTPSHARPASKSPGSPAPSGSATLAPSPSLTGLTVTEASDAISAILDRRSASGEIRSDVALDVRNQVHNLVTDPTNPAGRIDNLRRQLRDRLGEPGALSPAAQAELDVAVVNLGAALDRANTARASG